MTEIEVTDTKSLSTQPFKSLGYGRVFIFHYNIESCNARVRPKNVFITCPGGYISEGGKYMPQSNGEELVVPLKAKLIVEQL